MSDIRGSGAIPEQLRITRARSRCSMSGVATPWHYSGADCPVAASDALGLECELNCFCFYWICEGAELAAWCMVVDNGLQPRCPCAVPWNNPLHPQAVWWILDMDPCVGRFIADGWDPCDVGGNQITTA